MSQRTVAYQEVNALIRQVQVANLLVRQLQTICGNNGLSRGGVKADLRNRIVSLIQSAYNTNDAALFYKLKGEIEAVATGKPIPQPTSLPAPAHQPNYHATSAVPSWQHHPAQRPSQHPYAGRPNQAPTSSGTHPDSLVFKPSPFYEPISILGKVHECDAMAHHRNTVSAPIRLLDHPDLEKCVTGKEYRFGAEGEWGEIKANLRGLKKKPGSTRPVDITDSLRLRATYVNNVEFTYALTNKKFYLAIMLCKIAKAEDLVARIRNGKRILKATVLRDLINKSNDPDIETTAQVMSLKCPLSYMRLSLPCRGVGCNHVRCFDATSYLQLQEQGPQWVCPICNGPAPFDQLAVDEYVLDILSKTPRDLEQVTIGLNGEWKLPESPRIAPRRSTASFDLVDDLEMSSTNSVGVNKSSVTPSRSIAPSLGTPSMSDARESPAIPSRPAGGTSSKRPAPAVIDLTLSSDDEDSAPPAPKRQQLSFNSVQNPRFNGYYP